MDSTTPIWVTDWIFENDKGTRFVVKDIPCKGHNSLFIMKNKYQVNKAIKYISKTPSVINKLKPISVKLKKQIGFGKNE